MFESLVRQGLNLSPPLLARAWIAVNRQELSHAAKPTRPYSGTIGSDEIAYRFNGSDKLT